MMEMYGICGPRTALFGRLVEAELGAVVQNRDSPKDGDRECFAIARLVVYIQPFENRSVRLLVSYSTWPCDSRNRRTLRSFSTGKPA